MGLENGIKVSGPVSWLGALLGLCPEEEVDQDAQRLKIAQWLPVQPSQDGKDLLCASTGQPLSSGRTRTPWANNGVTPDSKSLCCLTPAAWFKFREVSGQFWRNVLVEPQIRAQIRPPSGGIQAPRSEAPLLAAINGVRLAKKRKTNPLLPPLRACLQDARLVVKGGPMSSLLPALCWEGLTRGLLAPRRQQSLQVKWGNTWSCWLPNIF